MAVLVGIDEAGYGPLLGPLVVSSTAFSLPDNLLKADLWRLLSGSIAKNRRRLAGRLVVADSKKVYSRTVGIRHLQRTVLALLKCLEISPSNISELVESLCPDCVRRLGSYPWYQGMAGRRLSAEAADITIASKVLKKELLVNKIKFLGVRSCCHDVAHYNQMVGKVRNKASVVLMAVLRLIKDAFDNPGEDDLQIIVDRQSGRVNYTPILRRSFPDMELRVLRQDKTNSSYELNSANKKMRLHFAVDADERFLPVSLASMVSKYLRELLVDCINRYFLGFRPGLKATAGYWKDGLRFVKDLEKSRIEYERAQLIRCR